MTVFPRSRSDATLSRVPSPCINTVIINRKSQFDSFYTFVSRSRNRLATRYQHFDSAERAIWPNSLAKTPTNSPEKEEQKGKRTTGKMPVGFLLVLREDGRRRYLRRPCCSPRRQRTNRWRPGCLAERRARGRPRQRERSPTAQRAGKGQRRSPAREWSLASLGLANGDSTGVAPGTHLPGGSSSEEENEAPGLSVPCH